jgi:hypothetical protein
MDYARLRQKGWTAGEIAHAKKVLRNSSGYDHFLLWMLVALLVMGGMGAAALLLPVMLFARLLAIPLGLLLGMCFGLLLTHSLRSLRMERKHHLRAFIMLACVSFISTFISVQLMEQRFRIIAGDQHSALFLCIPLLVGMTIPYIAERRLHGTA